METPSLKLYEIEIFFQDGCQFVMAGKNRDAGWHIGSKGEIRITCPHGSIMHWDEDGFFEEQPRKR